MLGKRSRPSVHRSPEPIMPGNRVIAPEFFPTTRSPIESKFRLTNGWKNHELGCVGLAIVAALDKPSSENNHIRPKLVVGSLNFGRSDPIPIGKNGYRSRGVEDELDYSESYTFVTTHEHNKTSLTKVYCRENEGCGEICGSGFDRKLRNFEMFFSSPPRSGDEFPATPRPDFLSSCYLCRKKLHGKDIYMYRGEKAFCSTECRNRQIVSDERKEKCGSEASKSSDSSLYAESRLFYPGVAAA